MDRYLHIRVTFLADRYHGQEWPPSPARLFQALLAGAKTGAARLYWPQCETALRSLESLPPPEILAVPPSPAPNYRLSVPNNDSDKAAGEWRAGRSFDASKLRTFKSVQPRQLPSAPSGQAHLSYLWQLDASSDNRPFQRLARHLHTLGWGLDMAFADAEILGSNQRNQILASGQRIRFTPAARGPRWLVPAPGCLDDLAARFTAASHRQTTRGVNTDSLPVRFRHQPYTGASADASSRPLARFLLHRLEDSSASFAVPWERACLVAAWARHAAAQALRQENYPADFVNSFVLGHGDGHTAHISFVPLPTVRRGHADGAIRRLLLLEPTDSTGDIADLLQIKLSPWTLQRLAPAGPPQPVCSLLAADGRDPVFSAYLGRSSAWATVTPVVLHGHNHEHGKFSAKKAEQLLSIAFVKAGFNHEDITSLTYRPAPFWSGTGAIFDFQVPAHLKKWPRYHVSVQFRQPVTGPLLVGIGQNYGIGLFATTDPTGTT